jgi:hypothetical protein
VYKQSLGEAPIFDAKNADWKQAPFENLSRSVEAKGAKVTGPPINRDQTDTLHDLSRLTDASASCCQEDGLSIGALEEFLI